MYEVVEGYVVVMGVDNVFVVVLFFCSYFCDGGIGVVVDGIDVVGCIELMVGLFLVKMR